MIETKVPMDIRTYKTKIVGPFTARQLVCIGIAAVADLIIYATVYVATDLSLQNLIYILLFIDVPILAFTISVRGMPMEKFIAKVLIPNFMAPTKRKAVVRIMKVDEQPLTQKEIKKNKKQVASYAKKDKKYIAYK